MSGETWMTIKGRLTADPETRFTNSGGTVANFTVAVNASKLDKQSNTWKDKPAKFWRCQAWSQGKLARAENVTDLLKKGDSVVVYGELETREYTTKEGEQRSADEIRVEAIGKDLTFHGQPGQAQRQSSAQQQGGNFGGQQQQSQQFGQPQGGFNPPPADPWATQPPQNNGWPQ